MHLCFANIFVGAKHSGSKSLLITNKLYAGMLRPYTHWDAPLARLHDAQKHAEWFVKREFNILVGRQESARSLFDKIKIKYVCSVLAREPAQNRQITIQKLLDRVID